MCKTVLIMAGGKGERFWPKSRQRMPKQFLSLTSDGKTMLQLTVERALNFADADKIFVVTNKAYRDIVLSQAPILSPENILCEPVARNTAPCAALAAKIAMKKFGDSVMVVMPADHLIKDTANFVSAINTAILAAETGENIITVGIVPTYAETGYGYINFNKNLSEKGCLPVVKFVEKPDLKTAQSYLDDGCYLWNSGMFVWKTSLIMEKFRELMPQVYENCQAIGEAFGTDMFDDTLEREFSSMPSESIDYGIMEKTGGILTIPGDFGWNDVGSWLALESVNPCDDKGNMAQGRWVNINSQNCTVVGNDRLIAAVGLKDIVIVDTPDAILVCHKDSTQDVKKVLTELRKTNQDQYL